MTQILIECACCLGAKQLTATGKSVIDCPLCNGGTITGKELEAKNIIYLEGLADMGESKEGDEPYDNNEY